MMQQLYFTCITAHGRSGDRWGPKPGSPLPLPRVAKLRQSFTASLRISAISDILCQVCPAGASDLGKIKKDEVIRYVECHAPDGSLKVAIAYLRVEGGGAAQPTARRVGGNSCGPAASVNVIARPVQCGSGPAAAAAATKGRIWPRVGNRFHISFGRCHRVDIYFAALQHSPDPVLKVSGANALPGDNRCFVRY